MEHKTDWKLKDTVTPGDMNRIEGNIKELEIPSFNDSGTVSDINSFTDFVNSVKSKMSIFDFFRNFKAGLKYIVHQGQIINSQDVTQAGFAMDARQANPNIPGSLGAKISDLNNNINMNSWLLFGGTGIVPSTDMNTLLNFGNYYCNSNNIVSTLVNCPTKQAFVLKVYSGTGTSYTYIIQELTTHNQAIKYKRCYNKENSTWTQWEYFITNSDLKTFKYSVSIDKSRDEAVKELFYSLPNDDSVHTGLLIHGQTVTCIVQKYPSSTYGSVLMFGYSQPLIRYAVGSTGWTKYTITETQISVS